MDHQEQVVTRSAVPKCLQRCHVCNTDMPGNLTDMTTTGGSFAEFYCVWRCRLDKDV